jgi:hypothetical protein
MEPVMPDLNDAFAEAFSLDDEEQHAPVGIQGPERPPTPAAAPDVTARVFREVHTVA